MKKYWLLTATAFLLFFQVISAQMTLADSLAKVLQYAPADTHRVILLTDLAWEINRTESEKALKLLHEALSLAQKLHFQLGEATVWNGLGVMEEINGNFSKALEHYKKALEIRTVVGDRRAMASSYNNLGTLYENVGQFYDAIDNYMLNLREQEALNDTFRIARAHFNLAGVYQEIGIYFEAARLLNEARFTLENMNDQKGMAQVNNMLGHISFELETFSQADAFYRNALKIYEELRDSSDIAGTLSNIANNYDEWGTQEKNMDSTQHAMPYYEMALDVYRRLDDSLGMAAIYNNMGTTCKHLKEYARGLKYLNIAMGIRKRYEDTPGIMETTNSLGDIWFGLKNYKKALYYTRKYQKIALTIKNEKFEQKSYKDLAKIYEATGNFKKAFEFQVKYDEMRYHRLNENRTQEFNRLEALFADRKKQLDLEKQKTLIAQQNEDIARTTATRNGLIGGAVALALLVVLFYNRSRLRARSNKQLASKNMVIERERKRADELLMNILPESAAAELKANNSVKPVRYESVTVLFSDFKGFTNIAEKVSPEALIEELDACFRMFDAIMERFGLEKIKTIGDAYMCAGGLPSPNTTHPVDMVNAAIEMQVQLAKLMANKTAEGKPVFEMRIGINSGPVVAGVVGSHKFAYDIWGDTVNIAARMEQGSEPNKINISGATYELVKDLFPCTYRGEIPAKNKGNIAMYFVDYESI
jgi:adenylate cyclase